jgi:pilus assembly protein CpaE
MRPGAILPGICKARPRLPQMYPQSPTTERSIIHQPGGHVPASTILLLEADPASGELISGILTGVGYTVTTVKEPGDAFAQAAANHLVVLDDISGPKTAIDLCREIRSTPSMAAIPVLCISQSEDVEERIRFLEAGADDVMAKPFDARELEARVEALLLRFQRSKDMAPVFTAEGSLAPKPRRTVAVFSPKGGVGTTTIATNIAIAQAQKHPDRVVLIDLHLQFGQVATHLNIEAKQSLADVVRDDAAMREPELLRTYATRHDSGLHVLAAPATPEMAELVEPKHVEQILQTVLGSYDEVVIDAGSVLDERTMAVFERADTVILPVYPEIAALKAVHALLEYLSETGSIGAKASFVLNNAFAREILKMRDVESALGTKVAAELPYDPFLYLKAVNEGEPIVRGAPRSTAAERLAKLAAASFNDSAAQPVLDGGERRQRRIGGLLRRS